MVTPMHQVVGARRPPGQPHAPSRPPAGTSLLLLLLVLALAALTRATSSSVPDNPIPDSCQARALWDEKVSRWAARRDARVASYSRYEEQVKKYDYKVYDVFEPEWDCELQDRVGKPFGDGGKFMCGLPAIAADDKCLVYSVGSHGEVEFEKAMLLRTACEVHTFDPTVELTEHHTRLHPHEVPPGQEAWAANRSINAYKWGLGDARADFSLGQLMPLRDIMDQLQHTHRPITVLKVDCDGCEYKAFASVFKACAAGELVIDQLLVELHSLNFEWVRGFFDGADACGLRLFHKERNHWGCNGYTCVEFSFVSERAARASFIRSHCPSL